MREQVEGIHPYKAGANWKELVQRVQLEFKRPPSRYCACCGNQENSRYGPVNQFFTAQLGGYMGESMRMTGLGEQVTVNICPYCNLVLWKCFQKPGASLQRGCQFLVLPAPEDTQEGPRRLLVITGQVEPTGPLAGHLKEDVERGIMGSVATIPHMLLGKGRDLYNPGERDEIARFLRAAHAVARTT